MTTIDRALLKILRTEINEALLSIGQKHGLTLEAGNATFDASKATFKLAVLAGAGSIAEAKHDEARANWPLYCALFGLKPEWLDKEVRLSGQLFTVAGLLPNRSKNCVQIKRVSTGKTFVTSAQSIKIALSPATAEASKAREAF